MYKYIAMDSEYCSMGRWISVIVGDALGLKLYEGKDLLEFVDEPWLTENYLKEFDDKLLQMSIEEAKTSHEMKKVHQALSQAIEKAIKKGPCIIHERAATELLKNRDDCLLVHLYNTSMEHRIPRAVGDPSFDLKDKSHDELVQFINHEDEKRRIYHDAVSSTKWGDKETYHICLDSDMLSREKCAEILIEAMKDVSLDLEHCANVIKNLMG